MLNDRARLGSRYFREIAERSRERLRKARRVADRCLNDEAVHRRAMTAVFVLEDTHFVLEEIARAHETSDTGSSLPCETHPANDAA